MSKSPIEWTEQTWNPIVGCSIVSPGCTNCYAMKMAARTEAMGLSRYDGTTKRVNGKAVWTGKLARAPEATLLAPLKRRKPTTYFVNSMGDLFHEDCPDTWIDQVFAVMALCPQHTFQVLTKRAKRMRDYCAQDRWLLEHNVNHQVIALLEKHYPAHQDNYDQHIAFERRIRHVPTGGCTPMLPLKNVWLGVSTERQQEADERIPDLLQTPAAVRFISAEPLLGAIDLTDALRDGHPTQAQVDGPYGMHYLRHGAPRLDWVIAGGESGPDARPTHPDWARGLRDQCAAAGVPFFFKQWGAWKQRDCVHVSRDHAIFDPDGSCQIGVSVNTACNALRTHIVVERLGKAIAGRHLDGQLHDAMPLTAPRQRTDDRLPIQN